MLHEATIHFLKADMSDCDLTITPGEIGATAK
jgi:hypothetical protein